VLVLEYIPDTVQPGNVGCAVVPEPLARSLVQAAEEFGRLGIVHTDFSPGDILFFPGDRPTRAVVIDFSQSGVREEEDDESWAEVVWQNADVRWVKKRLERFLSM